MLKQKRHLQNSYFLFRVVAPDSTKEINGYLFTGWGAHAQSYRCAYLTAAAAIGMTKEDVDTFLKRLDKCLSKFTAKEKPIGGRSVEIADEERSECENSQEEVKDTEDKNIVTVNR